MKTHTESEENYIKALYHLGGEKAVNNGALAQRIGAKGPSVTQAVKRLANKNLVEAIPYKGVKLTEKGTALATHILRKHRLWETFLVEKLGFGWEEVHDIAEQLEHVQSPEMVEKLAKYLGSPIHDPHGDPIPQPNGAIPPTLGKPLQQFATSDKLCVVRVEDAGPDFFTQLQLLNITLGSEFTMSSISNFDSSIQLRGADGTLFWLSHSMSSNIYAISL